MLIKIITAIGNPYLNNKIKNMKNYNIVIKDIQYFEGILEYLSIDKEVKRILISTNVLIKKENIELIISEFKNLEIIIFMDKRMEKDIAYFNSKEIFKIFSNDINGYEEYLKKIDCLQNNITEQVKNDMYNLKKEILLKQFSKKDKNYLIKKDEPKSFIIAGTRGSGKSTFITVFSKHIEKHNKKVCILDCCTEGSSINIIFGKNKNEKIQKLSKNISYIKNTDIEYTELKKMVEELKEKYECILIDTNVILNNYKNINNISDEILFFMEPDLIELQKAKMILEIFEYDLEILNSKVKLIFNKVNKFHISKEILKEIFLEYEILSYIDYSPEYTLYINKNSKYNIREKAYEEIYTKIF